MKWLVQEFLNYNPNVTRVMEALDELHVEYLLVRVNKDDSLTVLDKESKLPLNNSEEALQSFVLNESVMFYGSKAIAKIATDMNLVPGSFMNEKFEFEVFRKEMGRELLNYDFNIGELSELEPIDDAFFIRPTGNTKLFPGMTVTRQEFMEWKHREAHEGSPYIGESLMMSNLLEIQAEYRFFVVNQRVITGSSYKIGDEFDSTIKPSKEIADYAQKMVNRFALSNAFVIDIAETSKGLKIVEYNNINTSALYGCDEFDFIQAINNLNNS